MVNRRPERSAILLAVLSESSADRVLLLVSAFEADPDAGLLPPPARRVIVAVEILRQEQRRFAALRTRRGAGFGECFGPVGSRVHGMSLCGSLTQSGRLHMPARRCARLPHSVCRPRSAVCYMSGHERARS